jgi:CDP-glucose 4,6-dehydratase
MFWNQKKVFVTGATGFIGGNLTRELLNQGAQVVTIMRDDLPTNTLRMLGIFDQVTIVRGDLADIQLLSRTLNEYGISFCFHLAAQALVGVAASGPLDTFETNIRGTYNLLEACRGSKYLKGVVVASTDKAYGVHQELPYNEDMPLLGLYPYDASKACADILTRSYSLTYGLPAAVTRNANIYGPGDMNFSRLIPDAIRSALLNRALEIRSDGLMERDFMYVDDAINGYLLLAESLSRPEIAGQAFNFGTQQPISVLDLCVKIQNISGSDLAPRVLNTAKYEIPKQFLDTGKARRLLGWNLKHTLEDGLKKSIHWYRELYDRSPALF